MSGIEILFPIGAYLLGSIPFGLLIGLARGVDIRQHGSKNIGATNAGRVLGRKWGYLCLVLDILKGLAPVAAAGYWLVGGAASAAYLGLWLLVGAAAVLGHVFPIYLGFRGGKGVATTIGVGLGIWPCYTVAMIAALAAYAIGRFATGIVSVGSLALAVVFPLAAWLYVIFDPRLGLAIGWPLVAGAALIGGLIVVRHRANIQRLMRGVEPRVDRSAATDDGSSAA